MSRAWAAITIHAERLAQTPMLNEPWDNLEPQTRIYEMSIRAEVERYFMSLGYPAMISTDYILKRHRQKGVADA